MEARILVVDDEEQVRHLIARILERNDYACTLAASAKEARDHLKERSFELLLSDLKMPGECGLDLIEYVLTHYPDTAAVIVSVMGDAEVVETAVRMGVYGYVVKPFEADELLINVTASLHRRKLEIENRLFRERLEQLVAQRTEALRESENKFRAISCAAQDAMVMIDSHGSISFWNEAASRIFGYSREEATGKDLHTLITPERYHETYKRNLKHFRQTGQGPAIGRTLELFAVRKDGSEFPVELSLSSVSIQGKWHAIGVVRDISERKGVEAQLAQAQKLEAVGQLAAGIAHEINTPTQYVGDNTRFLQDAFDDLIRLLDKYGQLQETAKRGTVDTRIVGEVEDLVEEIDLSYLREEIPRAIIQTLEGVERVSKIVRAMKAFSHPGTQEKTPVDINEAIENTITVARNEWKYVAEMTTNFDQTLPPVPCLPGDFNQAILNMVINAAHAIEEVAGDGSNGKGRITVTTRRNGRWAEIRIQDTGTGIPESIRSRIFDPFFTTKEVGKGTGQGLAIAHSVIVKKHGGTLSFETEPGQGTTFIVRLPIGEGAP